MRLLGHHERNQRQPHADKDNLAVFDLSRGGDDHEFVERVVHVFLVPSPRSGRAIPTSTGHSTGTIQGSKKPQGRQSSPVLSVCQKPKAKSQWLIANCWH